MRGFGFSEAEVILVAGPLDQNLPVLGDLSVAVLRVDVGEE